MLTNNANKQIGINIKRWREFKEIKQEELAKKLKITAAALSHIENGKTDVSISRIEQIAEMLQINFSLLLSNPQQIINNSSNSNKQSDTYHSQQIMVNEELIVALKTELQQKNEQINFLQSLVQK